MSNFRVHLTIMAVVSLGLGGCASGFQATYDHDPAQDFSGYKTYAWISEHPMIIGATDRIPSPLLESRIMQAIEDGLSARGYSKAPNSESADFALSFTVGSREEIQVSSYPATYSGYGYPRGWGWGGPYYGMPTETTVRQYQKGMLAIDVFDVAEHRPVFHAVATKSITDSDRKKLDETVQAAVDAILQGFPPQ
jgi:hypothetical protein